MATRNYRVGELEVKPNYTSVVRGYNFDSRYYVNDKDAPSEDTYSTDGAPDPNALVTDCRKTIDGTQWSKTSNGTIYYTVRYESYSSVRGMLTPPMYIYTDAGNPNWDQMWNGGSKIFGDVFVLVASSFKPIGIKVNFPVMMGPDFRPTNTANISRNLTSNNHWSGIGIVIDFVPLTILSRIPELAYPSNWYGYQAPSGGNSSFAKIPATILFNTSNSSWSDWLPVADNSVKVQWINKYILMYRWNATWMHNNDVAYGYQGISYSPWTGNHIVPSFGIELL